MKKILFISNIADSKIGSFSMASIIASNKSGMEFHIAANFSAESIEQRKIDEEKYNIKIHHIDFIRNPMDFRNFIAYRQLIELIKKEKFDMIHCNTPIGGVCGRIAGKNCNVKKVIYQAHGFHFYKGAPKKNWFLYYPIEKWLAKYTDVLITITKEDYELAQTRFKLRNDGTIYYVPGVGVDNTIYNVNESIRLRKRKELGIPLGAYVLVSVGELNKNKNNQVVISAIAQMKNHSIHYVLCGNGELKEYLQNLADAKGIRDNVHILGYREDVKDILKMSDCLIMPSYREGLSRAIMEAMASGLPVACSRIRGNVDLIDESLGGTLFDCDNIDDVTKAIYRMMSFDHKKMGNYNLEKVKEYSLDSISQKIYNIYVKEM